MTPKQVELVQSSFASLLPLSDAAASLFYGQLFEIAPDCRKMFKTDLKEQGRKLMLTLGAIVYVLNEPETLQRSARALATRHINYGVRPDHYEAVGDALIAMLEQMLGRAFTDETREAWIKTYEELSSAMIDEAYGKVR